MRVPGMEIAQVAIEVRSNRPDPPGLFDHCESPF
jgi:hypothetical protein